MLYKDYLIKYNKYTTILKYRVEPEEEETIIYLLDLHVENSFFYRDS